MEAKNHIPKLFGLVLSGGKSTRMGKDKGLLQYHGMPQREYLYQLLTPLCDTVFLSIRSEQEATISTGFHTIIDEDVYRGPFNGILSAHEKHPNVAWLVLACDLPMLDKITIEKLILERDSDKAATAYATHESQLPEPLITIWEPSGLERAVLHMQTAESSCPRKFLINSDIKLVFPEQDDVLYNANSLKEYEFAKRKLY